MVFFDNDKDMWRLCDKRGREWPLHSSPIAERDACVIFDERRCRGADMKLKVSPQMNMGWMMLGAISDHSWLMLTDLLAGGCPGYAYHRSKAVQG